jgi:DNA-binding NarL/FixJ family response regulator
VSGDGRDGFRARAESASVSVLVVEDDDLFARGLIEYLEASGQLWIVGTARDGREAVDLAATLNPDVVVMDIQMPVMDGVEATRQIHAQYPSMPVVLISGFDYEERVLAGLAAGAVDYVRKGRIEADLVAVLLALASRRQLPNPSSASVVDASLPRVG